MACTITSGIGLSCSDLRRVAGLNKRVWLFNLDDLRTPIDPTLNFITNLNLTTYALIYKFEGTKYSHSAESKLVRTDSGNVSYEHTVNLKINNTTYQEDQVLEALGIAETGAIVQSNNKEFFIYGGGNGLICMEQTDATGTKSNDDEMTSVVLKGTETTYPKRLILPAGTSGDSFQQTLFYLNSITNVNITV
jgi:hypothetical protein